MQDSTYTLSKPITTLNGKDILELTLKWNELSYGDLKTANRIAKMVEEASAGNVDNATVSPRLDPNLRIGIAWVAAMKGTQGLSVNDVLNLPLVDSLCLSEETLTNYLFFR